MNIGIIVHSQTGHTLSVAEKLKESLTLKGHTVTLERVSALENHLGRRIFNFRPFQ